MHPKASHMRVFVTGGAGFIGSHVCDILIANNQDVVCFDILGENENHNVTHLITSPHFSYIRGDVRNEQELRAAMRGCTHVAHLAALASVPRSIAEPSLSEAINLQGTLNVIAVAEAQGIEKLVFSSTAAVYGDAIEMPVTESTPTKCLSPYAEHKLSAEKAVLSSSIPSISLRYFNVHGARQDPHGAYAAVIPKFIEMMVDHSSPTIFGDGSATRDFVSVEDVAALNLLALQTDSGDAINEIYNVASGTVISILDLFKALKELLANHDSTISNISPDFKSIREGDIQHSSASITKAKELLKFNPETNLLRALSRTVEAAVSD